MNEFILYGKFVGVDKELAHSNLYDSGNFLGLFQFPMYTIQRLPNCLSGNFDRAERDVSYEKRIQLKKEIEGLFGEIS